MKKWVFAILAYVASGLATSLILYLLAGYILNVLKKPYTFELALLSITTAITLPWILSLKTYEHFLWQEAKWKHARYAQKDDK